MLISPQATAVETACGSSVQRLLAGGKKTGNRQYEIGSKEQKTIFDFRGDANTVFKVEEN
jgi:hypothetical protein